ncbi:hypothetical protein ACHAXT_009195 [Thalassiosira profunda]
MDLLRALQSEMMKPLLTKTNVVIVGTGDMSRGLTNMYHCFGDKQEFDLVVTEPLPDVKVEESVFTDKDVDVETLRDALLFADMVILAIPGKHIQRFLESQKDVLCDGTTVLVDISNSYVAGDDIEKSLYRLHLHNVVPWCRAFNDNGGVNLMTQHPSTKAKLVTEICGKDKGAVEKVKRFAQEGLGFSVKTVPHDRIKDIQSAQQSLGKEWIDSAIILVAIFVLFELYAILRYNHYKGYAWYHLPIQVTNKAICSAAIYGFSLSMVPGIFVKLGDLARDGRATRKIPSWLLHWLKLRKHLGLLSLYFLAVHVVMSLLIFNEHYYGKFYESRAR